jgi:hypothetical protein
MPDDDLLTYAGAEELRQRLDEYWRERGYNGVRHWIVTARVRSDKEEHHHHLYYCIRSNLIAGLPPRK